MLADSKKLFQDVSSLTDLGERSTRFPDALEVSAEFLFNRFADLGYGVREHVFEAHGVPCKNIEAIPHEFSSKNPHLLIGAHYDSAPGTPGADDNASAVAVMLALAKRFAGRPSGFRFVAFVNEEPPHFYTDTMGSTVFARECAHRDDKIEAMICLESLGVFLDEPGTQFLPPSVPLDLIPDGFDPTVGNFVAVVGNNQSMDVAGKFAAVFRGTVPAVAVELPELELSDHLSFWHAGFRAIMLTDTALFRNQHYHLETDTPEKLDYPRMAQAADCIGDAIEAWLSKR
jgi:Zn-dependent M28 family amino/carboxypeptidase